MILRMEAKHSKRVVTVECERKRCRRRAKLEGPLNDSTRTILETAGWQMGTLRDKARDICPECKAKGLQ